MLPSVPHPTLDLALRRFSELVWIGVLPPLLVLGRWRVGRPFLLAALVYLAELLAVSLLVVPVLWYRTVLPVVVPVSGFVAVMLTTPRQRVARCLGAAAIAVLAIVAAVGWLVNGAHSSYEPWASAGELVDAVWRPGLEIFVYPADVVTALELTSSAARASRLHGIAVGADARALPIGQAAHDDAGHLARERPRGALLVSRWDIRTKHDPTRMALDEAFAAVFGPPELDRELEGLRVRVYPAPGAGRSADRGVSADAAVTAPP
jgi:hypothetical protein